MRSDALYYCEACEKRHKRRASTDKGPTRRPSRDGRGARLYVLPEEIAEVRRAMRKLGSADRRFAAKLDRAAERTA